MPKQNKSPLIISETSNKLSLLYINVQSLSNKVLELNVLLDEEEPNVFCISETWMREDAIKALHLENYTLISFFSRRDFRGGGTAIFAKKDFNNSKFSSITIETQCIERVCEFCIAGLEINKKLYVFVCICRSPSGDFDQFLNILDEILNAVFSPKKFLIFCGDFNCDFSTNNDRSFSLLQLFSGYGLVAHVSGATRNDRQLDNIFSNITSESLVGQVLVTNISDHYGLTLKFNYTGSNTVAFTKRRFFTDENITTFKNYLYGETWDELFQVSGVDEKYECFFRTLFYYFDMSFPVCTSRVKNAPTKWINSDIKKYSQHVKDLYVWYQHTKSPVVYQRYKEERKTYRKYLADYYSCINENRIANSKNKIKTAWNIVNTETNRKRYNTDIILKGNNNEVIDDPKAISEIFSDQFYLPKLPLSSVTPVCDYKYPTIFLTPVDPMEVFRILMKMPNKYSSGLDEIPIIILKHIAHLICEPLASVINECYTSGKFPSKLKTAKLTPIYKKGDRRDPVNYRPISLLSSVSKVFERSIYNRIMSYLNQHNILAKEQFGFRPELSTELAIFNTLTYIIDNLDKNNAVAGLFFISPRLSTQLITMPYIGS